MEKLAYAETSSWQTRFIVENAAGQLEWHQRAMIFYGVQYNGWWSVGGLVVVTFGLENERRRAYCDLRVGKSRRVFPVILRSYLVFYSPH